MHLDAATGTGLGPHLLMNTMDEDVREGAIIIATDLSKPMLKRLEIRMKQSACFTENEKNSLNVKYEVEKEVKIEEEYEGVHLKAYVANSMSLPFKSAIFDSYTAGFSLMVVDDPLIMIKEAFRVLKPGKRAGFTVVREVIGIVQILKDAMLRAMLPPINLEMDKFLKLGKNPEEVVKMMEESGFTNIKYWSIDSVLPYCSGEEVYDDIFKVPFAPTNLNEEEKAKLKIALVKEWKEKWDDPSALLFA